MYSAQADLCGSASFAFQIFLQHNVMTVSTAAKLRGITAVLSDMDHFMKTELAPLMRVRVPGTDGLLQVRNVSARNADWFEWKHNKSMLIFMHCCVLFCWVCFFMIMLVLYFSKANQHQPRKSFPYGINKALLLPCR